jgi:hypothetical protein
MYAALSDEEHQQLVKVGKVATDGAKYKERGSDSSFGLRSREVARRQSLAVRVGQASRASPAALVGHAVPVDMGSRCDSAIAKAVQTGGENKMDLPAILSSARAVIREDTRIANLAHRQAAQQLAEWKSTRKNDVEASVWQAVPQLLACSSALEAIPNGLQTVMQLRHPTMTSSQCVAQIAAAQHSTNLAAGLDNQWSALHSPILHQDCEVIEETLPSRSRKRPPCYAVGVCLCGESGSRIADFRGKFYNALKLISKRGTVGRDALLKRLLVVKLSREEPAPDDSPWAQSARDCHEGEEGPSVIWWHISAHSLSPYESSFRQCAYVREDARGALIEVQLEVSSLLFKPYVF